jgi:adenylate cyclase
MTTLLDRLLPPAIDDAVLPARVRDEIRREQQRGDILMGAVQATLCVVLAILYAFARKTYPPDAPFTPVPWALAAYAAFTAFRLAEALRRRLPAWLHIVSAVVDIALLVGLIWSFHIQYMQVPAFYLKAPTLLYLFVFIAIRALRFDARYVLLTGALAAAGWLALVLYAVSAGHGATPVTRDFVAYMTGALVLWGAEVDKIVSLLLVTLLLAVAITRARRLLLRAVAEGEAARDLKRFFSADVAARITGSERTLQPGEGEMREAATLFLDLRGFTKLSHSLDPNALVQLLTEYQSRFVPVIRRHGGSIDKFLGDGIMASFGAVEPSAACAADAVRAVEELAATADAWRVERGTRGLPAVDVGMGLAVGPTLVGVVGEANRLEYTVIGEAVNLAAKLEKHTKVSGASALTTRSVAEMAERQGHDLAKWTLVLAANRVPGVRESLDLVGLPRRAVGEM